MALPKANRLRHRQDFATVYQRGTRRKTSHLTLRALRQPRLAGGSGLLPQSTRIGFSISRKVSKRAVVRNRVKRQLRECLRRLLSRLVDGWDVVIVVHPEIVQCDRLQYLQELEQLLIDAALLKIEVIHGHS